MERRKVTYRLYPTPSQEVALLDMKGAHLCLYNAFLEQRRLAWRRKRVSIGKSQQSAELTQLAKDVPEIGALNAQSRQVTLKRVDLAFQAFFRRVKKGETPGYPRFKSFNRFSDWGYATHGDGWKLCQDKDGKHGKIRLSGIGHVKIRGGMRDSGTPKTCDIVHRHGKWYVSVTILCEPIRKAGIDVKAFDWGVETYAEIVTADGATESVENPRWLRMSEAKLKAAYQARDAQPKFSPVWRHFNRVVANLHAKIARQRKDWQHKLSARLVAESSAIFTEKLNVKNMTQRPKPKPGEKPGEWLLNGASAKAGLNKSILDGAPSQFLQMLRYKAANAGIVLGEAPTRPLKPTQRCHQCWRVEPKAQDQRWHLCPCGVSCSRDENSAWVNRFGEWSISVLSCLPGGASPPRSGTGLHESPSRAVGLGGEVQDRMFREDSA